jgi:uncharacterized protein (TIGR02246 family)
MIALLFSHLSCGPRRDEAAEAERLLQAVEAFHRAINSGDAQSALDFFTDDVIFMSNGWETRKGKADVGQIWTENIKSGFRTKDQQIIELRLDGDIAYEATTQLWTMHQEGQEDQWRSSKYVHIWNRQSDGTWRLHLDIWNNNPLPQ